MAKAGEEWARRIVEKDLKRAVVVNDDNSAPGMYDLRVGPADAPEIAIECVGAVDAAFTETWNMGPAKGALQLTVRGNWTVEIREFKSPPPPTKATRKGRHHGGLFSLIPHSRRFRRGRNHHFRPWPPYPRHLSECFRWAVAVSAAPATHRPN